MQHWDSRLWWLLWLCGGQPVLMAFTNQWSLPPTLLGEQTETDRCFQCFLCSQRQRKEDCTLIKAEINNESDNPTRDCLRIWPLRGHKHKHRDNTLPISLLLLVYFMPPLNPSPSLLSSLPHCTLLLSMRACEGRCLHAGCQVTGLIEGSPESCCYQSPNPVTALILFYFRHISSCAY